MDGQALDDISDRCKVAIKTAKDNYFSRLGNSLNDPNIGSKRYWSSLKQFLSARRAPKIPTIRNERNVLVSNVSEKPDIFNSFSNLLIVVCNADGNISVPTLPLIRVEYQNFAGCS